MAILEQIVETPAAPSDDEQLRAEIAHANLALLGAILNIEDDKATFTELFANFCKLFACEQAILLQHIGDEMVCVASSPDDFGGRRWPTESFADILDGRVLIGRRGELTAIHRALSDLISPHQPMLCLHCTHHASECSVAK